MTVLFGAVIVACGSKDNPQKSSSSEALGTDPSELARKRSSFESYWYQGLAELGRYDLEQMRYGEKRKGHAVMVFVTEDFRLDKQVKYEGGDKSNVASVLKLNMQRRFDTGVYPYSLLTSVFSEVEDMTRPVKISASVQEWCGHTFSQLNRRDAGYDFRLLSYFDNEGDRETELPNALTEDGLWALGRKDPRALPVGEVDILPALHVLRFRHVEAEAQRAEAALREVQSSPHGKSEQVRYELKYRDFGRRLVIYFEAKFPYRPLAWEEYDTSEGEGARTVAIRREEMMLDYWNHNKTADAPYREALGL